MENILTYQPTLLMRGLVALANRRDIYEVATVDNDFTIYRGASKKEIHGDLSNIAIRTIAKRITKHTLL